MEGGTNHLCNTILHFTHGLSLWKVCGAQARHVHLSLSPDSWQKEDNPLPWPDFTGRPAPGEECVSSRVADTMGSLAQDVLLGLFPQGPKDAMCTRRYLKCHSNWCFRPHLDLQREQI